jgi:hypothetical protein
VAYFDELDNEERLGFLAKVVSDLRLASLADDYVVDDEEPAVTSTARAFRGMCSRAGGREFRLSRVALAAVTGLDPKTVERSLTRLIKLNLLERTARAVYRRASTGWRWRGPFDKAEGERA